MQYPIPHNAPIGSENKIRVNIKQDIHGSILLSSAQMVEEYFVENEERELKRSRAWEYPPNEDDIKAMEAGKFKWTEWH